MEEIAAMPVEQARSFVFGIYVANGYTFDVAEILTSRMTPEEVVVFVCRNYETG